VTTVLIAFVDGFNPCSLWVLTILLAIVLHARSRRKVLIVGGTFLLTTAAVYGLFIVGVFSVLSYLGVLGWIRGAVAVLAAGFAAVNIKDYFASGRGPSLSIAASRKPGVYRRARTIRAAMQGERSTLALVTATVAMAGGVALVELPCTAGFPVIWSSALAAHEVAAGAFAALLGLYLLVYLADEVLVFGAAVVTMRAAKLQEHHGRMLKLAGGMVMLALAGAMAFAPQVMASVGGSLLLFAGAVGATALVVTLHRGVLPRLPGGRRHGDRTAPARDRPAHGPRGKGPPARSSRR
jgi:hypothetical protein